MSVLRFFMLLSLVIWVGGIIFFSFVVAPALFNILPTRHLSGLVVSRALTQLHWIGVICGGVFLICSVFQAYYSFGNWQATAARNVLVFSMVVVTLFSQIGVSTRMAALKAPRRLQPPAPVVHRAGSGGAASGPGRHLRHRAPLGHSRLERREHPLALEGRVILVFCIYHRVFAVGHDSVYQGTAEPVLSAAKNGTDTNPCIRARL